MPKRINFFQRVKKGFGNLFVSAEEKRRREKLQHAKEKAEYVKTRSENIQISRTNKEPWTSNELRGFQEIAMDKLERESPALEGKIDRRGTKRIVMTEARKKDIMTRYSRHLKNAESFKLQNKFELAGTFYSKAARMSKLMGDDQRASELEKIAEQLLRRRTIEKPELSDIKKTEALEGEIERRGTKIIIMDNASKNEIMKRNNKYLKNAKSYESRGKLALAEINYIRAAKMRKLMGNEQGASELENKAEHLREQILEKVEAEQKRKQR